LVNPAVAVEQTEITAKLGTDRWNAEVGQKVVWMVGAEQQSATLTLNPPDLGPVQVVIQVHNDQADTTFISQNPEVRQALQDGLSVLRDMMASSGVQLGEANIHSHEQSQQQHSKHTQQGQDNRGAMPDVMAAPAGALQTYVSNGLVDTFA
jgi:flagellar hook-length control protein FliK